MNLTGFGKDFLVWSLSLPDSVLEEVYLQELDQVNIGLKDRVRENTAFAKFGLRMLERYLHSRGITDIPFEDKIQSVDIAQIENLGTSEQRKSVVDSTIEGFAVMAGQKSHSVYNGEHYCVSENELKLDIKRLYPEFKKWAREYGWDDEVLDRYEFMKQLRQKKYFKGYIPRKMGGINVRVFVLDLDKMGHLEIEGFGVSSNDNSSREPQVTI